MMKQETMVVIINNQQETQYLTKLYTETLQLYYFLLHLTSYAIKIPQQIITAMLTIIRGIYIYIFKFTRHINRKALNCVMNKMIN